MLKDQKELLSALNAHSVDYLIVGGHAAIAYGVARLTKDLDVLIRSDDATGNAVYAALTSFGAPMETLRPEDFSNNPNMIIQLGVPPNRIDILQSIEGLSFEEVWRNHIDFNIEAGTSAHYISLDDLIRNKELVGRPGDLADVDELRKIRNLK